MSLQAFVSSSSSTNGDGFIETARLIAGEDPPRWLAEHLQRWSSSVMLDGMVHAKQPGKAEARARLQKVSEAAELVVRELDDPIVADCLLADEYGPLPDRAPVDVLLNDVQRRADAASSRLALLGTGLDERLEGLSDGLKLIAREFQDQELSQFLRAEQIIGPPAPTKELGAFLEEMARQSDAALLSPYLANESGKTKAGRARALPPGASSPRAFCAAVILEAWARFHDGKYPPASNLEMAAAAEEFWRACGGETKGGWNFGQPTAWRPYFEQALEDSLTESRKELRRHMTEASANNL
jgi:hypothetical protein